MSTRARFDLVVRGGLVVNADGRHDADVAVSGDAIADVRQGLPAGAREIDARGLVVMPALVDAHVHFNEPGRADWEGAATGSRALAAGGGTCFCDMPLNSTPCTVTAAAVDAKRAALEAASIADFALWGASCRAMSATWPP
jgi:allantoinase